MHQNDLIGRLPERHVEKGEILLHQGDHATHAYLVIEGCLRSYVTDAQGKEHILQFSPEGWIAADMKSLVRKVPAVHGIDALEPTRVAMMDANETFTVDEDNAAWLAAQVKGMRNRVIVLTDRIAHLLASDAETRYLDFVETYPSLVQRLPQKLIASYLGITPESLSRVRRQLVKKKK